MAVEFRLLDTVFVFRVEDVETSAGRDVVESITGSGEVDAGREKDKVLLLLEEVLLDVVVEAGAVLLVVIVKMEVVVAVEVKAM